MVQDTAWALETYAGEVDDLNEDKPHAYIRIFGVLNGLVIQQDAAFQLFRGVGTPKAVVEFATSGAWASSIPSLARARQIRIAGAGHPVEWGKKKNVPTSTFIVQQSVNSRGCQLILRRHDGKTEWQHVSLKALIEGQHETLAEQCRMAITELKADDEEHRMKYVSTPLTSIFKTCDYWTPKVALAVYDSEPSGLGLGGLQTVEDALQRFRTALTERDRPFEEPFVGSIPSCRLLGAHVARVFSKRPRRAGPGDGGDSRRSPSCHGRQGDRNSQRDRQRIRVTSRQLVAPAAHRTRPAGCRRSCRLVPLLRERRTTDDRLEAH